MFCRSYDDGTARSVCVIQWYPHDTGIFTTSSADKQLKIWDTNELTVSHSLSPPPSLPPSFPPSLPLSLPPSFPPSLPPSPSFPPSLSLPSIVCSLFTSHIIVASLLTSLPNSFPTPFISPSLSLPPSLLFPSYEVVERFRFSKPLYTHTMSSAHTHSLMAVGGAECKITLCDLQSGSSTHVLRCHRRPVMALAWSPRDDHLLASGR